MGLNGDIFVVGISGNQGAGKTHLADTIGNYSASQMIAVLRYSMAKPVYEICSVITGEDVYTTEQKAAFKNSVYGTGDQQMTGRKMLQIVGTDFGRTVLSEDIWVQIAKRRFKHFAGPHHPVCIIDDVRFPNEVALLDYHIHVDSGLVNDSHQSEAFVPWMRERANLVLVRYAGSQAPYYRVLGAGKHSISEQEICTLATIRRPKGDTDRKLD